MRRIRLTVSYDGTNYCGSQVQPNGVTVEEKLNESIRRLTGDASPVIFASRTDSGVHAMGNIAVFDTKMRMAADKFTFALNQRLPEDIRIRASEEVAPDWHPRKQNCTKTYLYRIYNHRIPDPLVRLYSQFCYYPLDIEKMRQAVRCLTGEHDFACFCSARSQAENTVRTIYGIELTEEKIGGGIGTGDMRSASGACDAGSGIGAGDAGSGEGSSLGTGDGAGRLITMRISGSGFLYNMVRIIAGTLLQIGSGIRPVEDMEQILRSRERKQAGPVAGACGLTLLSIDYEKELQDFIEVENEDWSYVLDQRELKAWKKQEAEAVGQETLSSPERAESKPERAESKPEQTESGQEKASAPAAYLTIRRCAGRDYEALLTRLFHQNYRNGAACTFVRDLEAPERLAEGQKYGFYSIFPAGAGVQEAALRSQKSAPEDEKQKDEKLDYVWKACE